MNRKKFLILGGASAVMVAALVVFLISPRAPGPDGGAVSRSENLEGRAAETNGGTTSRPKNSDGHAPETDGFTTIPGEAGRLRFPGTDIDDAVMIAKDNEYFLRRDEQGNENIWGCYFLDFECTPDSQNLIVYGHSLKDNPDGQRFSQLKRLNDDGFAAENNKIYLTVRGTEYEFEVFSHGVVPAEDNSIVINANPTDTEMRDIIGGAIERSTHDYSADVSEKDKLLTLATCTADAEQRFVVVAKQVR